MRSGSDLVGRAWIQLRDEFGRGWEGRSEEDGTFGIRGLHSGTYSVRCGRVGFVSTEQKLRVSGKEPFQRLDLDLVRAHEVLITFLTPGGERVLEAVDGAGLIDVESLVAVASMEPLGAHLPLTADSSFRSNAFGAYFESRNSSESRYHPDECDGVLDISASFPLFISAVSGHVVLDSHFISGPIGQLTFTIDPDLFARSRGSLRAVIVESDTGEPSSTARITFGGRNARGTFWPQRDGKVQIDGIEPGVHGFRVDAPGYGRVIQMVTVEPGEALDLGLIQLNPAVPVSGFVTDAEGNGIRGARVQARKIDGFEPWLPVGYSGVTTSELAGSFELHLEPGEYTLTSYFERDGSRSAIVKVVAGDGLADGVQLVLQQSFPVAIEARVGSEGPFHVLIEQEHLVRRSWYVPATRVIDAALPPGVYQVTATGLSGSVIASETVEIQDRALSVSLGHGD